MKMLKTSELADMMKAGDLLIFDARVGKYDDGRRIPGAMNLSDKSSKAEVEALIKDKNAKVVTYCQNTRCPASERLAEHLKALGYTNVMEYPEGIEGWVGQGMKYEKK